MNQNKKHYLIIILEKKSIFILRPVNTQRSSKIKEHKANNKSGKEAFMCCFHIYHKFFMKFL